MDLPDELVADSEAQLHALSHPARHRLLRALPPEGATISGLARATGLNKGSVTHHLRVLRDAGLVRHGHTRTVRGGTERYFLPCAKRLRFPAGPQGATTSAMLETMAQEIPTDEEHLLANRRVRMSPQQARHLSRHLEQLLHELPEGPADGPTYSVVVGVYRRRPGSLPPPTG